MKRCVSCDFKTEKGNYKICPMCGNELVENNVKRKYLMGLSAEEDYSKEIEMTYEEAKIVGRVLSELNEGYCGNCWINFKSVSDFDETFKLIIGADGTYDNGDYFEIGRNHDQKWISKWVQYKNLQSFAFSLDFKKVKITQEFADYLNQKYSDLALEAEEEKEIDLSGDYIMDFNCWVKGKEDTPKYW